MSWSAKKVNEMCDWIADGFSMPATARLMRVPVSEVRRESAKVKATLGEQAR
jgi:hypothetical protein